MQVTNKVFLTFFSQKAILLDTDSFSISASSKNIGINNATVINEKASKIQKYFVLQITFDIIKFVGTVIASPIISSHATNESSIIRAKYLPFSKLNAGAFQI